MPQLTWLGDAQAKLTARRVPYRLLETVSRDGDADGRQCADIRDTRSQSAGRFLARRTSAAIR